MVGRILGGSMTDSKFWGRRRTLLVSAAVSAIAALVIAIATNFTQLVIGNLIMGLGVGLYWPSTEAVVADLSSDTQRNEAFALTRLADNVGLGLGVIAGGAFIALVDAYRTLFVIDAISFVIFLGVIYWAIPESAPATTRGRHGTKGWGIALRDKRLMIYVLVNIMITTYIAQIHSTMPLYFKNFAQQGAGLPTLMITTLFTWHLILGIVCQLPIARFLNRWSRPRSLMISVTLWGLGFTLVGITGMVSTMSLIWAVLGLGILAIANVAYTPAASSLVVDLAPESVRGVYFSINSLCWAIGYLIGPPLGGLALDQSQEWVDVFWLALATSVAIALIILKYLKQLLQETP